jgi:TonB family protein
MDGRRLQFSSPLEIVLAKIRRQEKNLWGRMQSWSHRCLLRLENNPLLQNYNTLVNHRAGVATLGRKPTIDLDSLFFISLLFHLLLFFLLTRITLPPSPPVGSEPIHVSFLELGEPVHTKTKKAEKKERKIARVRPKISQASAKAKPEPANPPMKAVPLLPAPKALAHSQPQEIAAPINESVDALIQLPTKQSETSQAFPTTQIEPLPAVAGEQAISLPKELRVGENPQTANKGRAGTSAGRSNPDYNAYLKMIEKRVQSVWRLPEGISGSHIVYLSFVLDRAGKLVRVEVVDSTDSRLNSSALDAMRRASPFPPIPDSIKELAGTEMFMKFPTESVVKGVH